LRFSRRLLWGMTSSGMGRSNRQTLSFARTIPSTLKMEATRSSETSVHNKPTRRHIPKDDIIQLDNSSLERLCCHSFQSVNTIMCHTEITQLQAMVWRAIALSRRQRASVRDTKINIFWNERRETTARGCV
jgi:hypothetical protein